jgi:drug/metabolite transporter (DMT)-like permease
MCAQQAHPVQKGEARSNWLSYAMAVTSVLAWALANILDVYTVLVLVQTGGRLALFPHHPAESFLIYAGLRLLLTLAFPLGVLLVSRRWPWTSKVIWNALTAGALVTAVAAWWRLYS